MTSEITQRLARHEASRATITVVRSRKPAVVAKRYFLSDGGDLKKEAVAHVSAGMARTVDVTTADDLVTVLQQVTSSTDCCIVPGAFHGSEGLDAFELVTEAELKSLTERTGYEDAIGGVHSLWDGRRVAARLKRGIRPSAWMLLDADNPPGIPAELARMNLAQRLAYLEPVIPGISTCLRVELRSSSSRVVPPEGAPGPRSHAFVKVTQPDLIEALRAQVTISMVNQQLAFRSPRSSRVTGDVVAHEYRTVVDLSVWITGRIIFNAMPQLDSGLVGYQVADPDIEVVNRDGGDLDIGWTEQEISAEKQWHYREQTGKDLSVAFERGQGHFNVSLIERGALTLDTQVEVRGRAAPLRDWLPQIPKGKKLRCEAPFRASESEAAVIFHNKNGSVAIYDVGTNTTYPMNLETPPADAGRSQVFPFDVFMEGGEKPEYIVQHLFARRTLYAIVAAPGAGKTAICLYIAATLARGEQLLGRKSLRCKVLYLCGENPDDVRLRLEIMLRSTGVDPMALADWVYFTHLPFAINEVEQRDAFVQSALRYAPFDLMIIDTGPAHSTMEDENDNPEMHRLAIAIRENMGLLGGPATLVLMHPPKGATKDNLVPRGGSAFTGSIDAVIGLWRESRNDPVEMFAHGSKFRGRPFEGEYFELREIAHPTEFDNFGDPISTVVAMPCDAPFKGDGGVDLALIEPDIRKGVLKFIEAVNAGEDWLGTSTKSAGNNIFHKSWRVHPAYPQVLLPAGEKLKQFTFKLIDQLIRDGVVLAETGPTRPEQRSRDWRNKLSLTQKGRAELNGDADMPVDTPAPHLLQVGISGNCASAFHS